jgi:hypothetical protein
MSALLDAPPRGRLLYLSISDGLDARTNKEIATLSRKFAIDFVGISREGKRPFFADQVHRLELIHGRSRSPATLAKLWWRVIVLRWQNHYDTVHVINEDLYLLLLPLLVGQRVVLDVFDSSFLKWRVPRWVAWLGQRLSYALPAKIIVTDEERAGLMPEYVRLRVAVIPNYPFRYEGPPGRRDSAVVRILYAGSLLGRRGTFFLEQLLSMAPDVRVVVAGWIRDESTRALSQHLQVEWVGLLPQQEIIAQATRCDFILCHYEPVNLNNIYASPNKIYDAIQAGAAIIINPEVLVSRFVREHNLGVVLDAYQPADMNAIAQLLREFKTRYRPDPVLRDHFLWENVENLLLEAHGARN